MNGFYPAGNDIAPRCATVLIPILRFFRQISAVGDRPRFKLRRFNPTNQRGFTLIELTSVLIIMGVMVSVGIKKFDVISDSASLTAMKAGVKELNTRETLEWSKMKLSGDGYSTDLDVFNAVDKDLGARYLWESPPTVTGGTLRHGGLTTTLNRHESTVSSIGYWE
jgi:prepilin-type N-terminal cleavage/methylation domain-containing protein